MGQAPAAPGTGGTAAGTAMGGAGIAGGGASPGGNTTTGTGGIGMGSIGGVAGGTTAGGGSIGGGFIGGLVGGAGGATGGVVPTPGIDAGASADASLPRDPGDAGLGDAQPPDGGVPDAGEGGAPGSGDAGCVFAVIGDAGSCPGYGCRTNMQQLRISADNEGACTSTEALAAACEGRATRAALRCAREEVPSLNPWRAISSCLERDSTLAQLGPDCLDCFVDDAVCSTARCFTSCTMPDSAECTSCRRQQCGTALAVCTGLPTP